MGLTRQPTEGRRKGGGLRIGEMERDTVLSHGISNFVKESMMERSDKFCWCVCKRCGTLVAFNVKENINICKNCKNDDVAVIHTPYAFKLFIQELETMGIQPRINTEAIDMPVDQADFVRIGNGNDSDDEDANRKDDDDDGDDADADIDYSLFNSQVDNFATANTIKDEKTWKDTYNNKKYGKVKGGMYEEEESSSDEEESVSGESGEGSVTEGDELITDKESVSGESGEGSVTEEKLSSDEEESVSGEGSVTEEKSSSDEEESVSGEGSVTEEKSSSDKESVSGEGSENKRGGDIKVVLINE
jgi:hypothetical protein